MNQFTYILNALFIISYRDILKFINDKARVISTFIFPFIFIGILGNSLQSNLGARSGINFLTLTFTGILGLTLFQSAAQGVISLIEDRENDFSQEMFVSPIPRSAIILGKMLGESLVALLQAGGILIFGIIIGIHITFILFLQLLPVLLLASIFGAGFGILILSNLSSQRSANQIFPFIFLPQLFISGVFAPIKSLPWYLLLLAKIAPLTYIIDLLRNVFYSQSSQSNQVVLHPFYIDLIVILVMLILFVSVGTLLFIKNERNK